MTGKITEDPTAALAGTLLVPMVDPSQPAGSRNVKSLLSALVTYLSGALSLGTAASKNTGTAAGNVPVLDGSGLLDTAVLPALAITDVFAVASQSAMLGLSAQRGDIAIRSDLNKSFALSTNSPSVLADWKELLTPTDSVLSVAGLGGAISASALRSALGCVSTVKTQTIASSGTYTPSAGMVCCIIRAWGGGGGGGGGVGATAELKVAAGGGAGGYSEKVCSAADIGASKAVTIGTGGAGGIGNSNGGAGGDTSVGSLCIAKGAFGGAAATYSVDGALGGLLGTGDFTAPGARGGHAYGSSNNIVFIIAGGDGASGQVGAGGTGGRSASAAASGGDAYGHAAGGGGASVHNTTSSANGGAGASGLVVITEYCTN